MHRSNAITAGQCHLAETQELREPPRLAGCYVRSALPRYHAICRRLRNSGWRPCLQIEESDRWELFERLVREIGVGLLTSSEADGALHTRPLQTLRVTRDALWFFTDR